MNSRPSKAWFAAKRFGYGAGWPISWQGWLTLAVFFVALAMAVVTLSGLARVLGIVVVVVCLAVVAGFKTEGGWRLRWGKRD